MGWEDYIVPVTSGILVTIILGSLRMAWTRRRRVPLALSRRVRRKTYLGAVLSESAKDTQRLDVVSPRLAPAAESPTIAKIRAEWKRINERCGVRVVIFESDDSIRGGVELLNEGIAVRLAQRVFGMEHLSFHRFEREPATASTAIVNHRNGRNDHPVILDGIGTQALSDFESLWGAAQPLEAFIAKKICDTITALEDPEAVREALKKIERQLDINLRDGITVLPHLAFGNSCRVVFILGLPGAGKSHVRRALTARLATMGIETEQLSDYSFIYGDFLRALVELEPARGTGFKAHPGGAFEVSDIEALAPGLQALAKAVRVAAKEGKAVVIEFARPDLLSALREFDDLRHMSRVIYVDAPAPLRAERRNRRIERPGVIVTDQTVCFKLTDNHLLPPDANEAIYAVDNIKDLESDSYWGRRVFRINNDVDDGGAKIDARIDEFVKSIVDRYRVP
ncbi:hypothetical protein [Nonomuraea insulae]|uniref:Uncharacterized protein n=1 Tax=Nonomuraea insulae TaxID=1616787 RepID=A0ABW1CKQ7_9ACTN